MQKLPEELNPQIENLLLSKSYEELSSGEIKLIEQHLSKVDYEAFRRVLLLAQDTFKQEDLNPAPFMKSKLTEELRAHKSNSKSLIDHLSTILNYPVPAWKLGVASIVFILSFYFYNLNSNWQIEKTWSDHSKITNDSLASNQSRSVKADKELLNLLRGVQ